MKGASEKVLEQCAKYMNEKGDVVELDDAARNIIAGQIKTYAKDALRTIAIAYKDVQQGECGEKHDEAKKAEESKDEHQGIFDIELKQEYTLIAIIGIQDTIRTEVP